ncbi:hypothetical protein BJ165DRAFT_1597563 [Panaeolus papilionaceus]|nr:hypothetical protein BJ165DRAFT_1597563 [Panaeolus papilionaceus]
MFALLECRCSTSHFVLQPSSHNTLTTMLRRGELRITDVYVGKLHHLGVISSLICGTLESAIAAFLLGAIWFIDGTLKATWKKYEGFLNHAATDIGSVAVGGPLSSITAPLRQLQHALPTHSPVRDTTWGE